MCAYIYINIVTWILINYACTCYNPICPYTERQNWDAALKQRCILTEWEIQVSKVPLKMGKPFFKVSSLSLPVSQLHLRTKNDSTAWRNDVWGTDFSERYIHLFWAVQSQAFQHQVLTIPAPKFSDFRNETSCISFLCFFFLPFECWQKHQDCRWATSGNYWTHSTLLLTGIQVSKVISILTWEKYTSYQIL